MEIRLSSKMGRKQSFIKKARNRKTNEDVGEKTTRRNGKTRTR